VPDPEALADLAQSAAEQAATLIIEGLERVRDLVETKSTGTDMVTEMDRAAENLIVEVLLHHRPDDAITGEEGTARPGRTGVQWLIDPIDGTTNYLYAHPGFAVSIAAAVDGTPVAGVVVDPLHREVFRAVRGGGATRNAVPIAVSSEQRLGHALVATGFGYDPVRRTHQAGVLRQVIPHVRDIRRMGAAAVDFCSVACGRVDAYYELGLQPWDHAAGALIAAEAGAIVTDLEGGPPADEFVLAANPALHEPLRQLLLGAGAGGS
jgi:myo-inositol-1(or 4)-monophosphatase